MAQALQALYKTPGVAVGAAGQAQGQQGRPPGVAEEDFGDGDEDEGDEEDGAQGYGGGEGYGGHGGGEGGYGRGGGRWGGRGRGRGGGRGHKRRRQQRGGEEEEDDRLPPGCAVRDVLLAGEGQGEGQAAALAAQAAPLIPAAGLQWAAERCGEPQDPTAEDPELGLNMSQVGRSSVETFCRMRKRGAIDIGLRIWDIARAVLPLEVPRYPMPANIAACASPPCVALSPPLAMPSRMVR